jgi:hypothetical protein
MRFLNTKTGKGLIKCFSSVSFPVGNSAGLQRSLKLSVCLSCCTSGRPDTRLCNRLSGLFASECGKCCRAGLHYNHCGSLYGNCKHAYKKHQATFMNSLHVTTNVSHNIISITLVDIYFPCYLENISIIKNTAFKHIYDAVLRVILLPWSGYT